MKRFMTALLAVVIVLSFSVSASARLVGDVNSDGTVTSNDALQVLLYTVGKPATLNEKYADVNGDGEITSMDALIILKIAIGTYDGDLEVEDELVTSYLADVLGPIMESGEYTIKTEVVSGEQVSDATIMAKGKDICIEMTVDKDGKKTTIRFLILGDKKYIIIPDAVGTLDFYDEFDADFDFSVTDSLTAKYLKSEYVTVEGKEYICESYEISNGSVSQYYFQNGVWKMLGTVKDGDTQIQTIKSYKKGVDKTKFSISGMIKVDLSSAMSN